MTSTEPAQSPPNVWTKPFATVVFTQMAFGYAASTFLLVPKYLATELHASASQIGRVAAIPGFAAAVGAPFLGGLLDKVGRKPLIALGGSLAVASGCLWLLVDHLGPLVYALQLLNGVAFMITFNAASTLATDRAPPERIGQAIGLFGAANMSMSAIAPAVAEPLAARAGWHAAFLLSACAGLVALVLARRIDERERTQAERDAKLSIGPTLTVARSLRAHLFTMVTCGASYGAVFTYYQPFVIAQGAKQVSLFFVGFTLAAMTTRLGLGSLPDRLGRRRVALSSYAYYALMVLLMTQLTPTRLLGMGFLFGCAHGFFYPALNALCVEQTRPEQRGRVMTLVNGSFQLGFMLSVLAFGWVAERYGYRAVFELGSLTACVGVATLHFEGSGDARARPTLI